MAEAAAARREARRRRILENSHNRLQLISGKSADDCPRESPVRTVRTPEPVHEVSVTPDTISSCSKNSLNNGVIVTETNSLDLLSSFNHDIPNHDIAAGDGEIPGDLASFASPSQETTKTTTSWEKLINYRYDIVLLSIIIQLLYSLSLITFEGSYFFLPAVIYAITKLIWFPAQSNSKLSNALMLLQGMSSYKVQKIIYLTQCVGIISRDICIYLFATICIQSFIVTLKNVLNT